MLTNCSSHMVKVGKRCTPLSNDNTYEKSFIWLTRENKFIRYLNEALDRIHNKTFGICIECENMIPEERLKEVPHTQHCVNCKKQNKMPKFTYFFDTVPRSFLSKGQE